MKIKMKSAMTIAALMATVVCREAEAIPLPPGASGVPTPSAIPGTAQLAQVVGNFVIPNTLQGDIIGTIVTTVYAPEGPAYDTLGLGGVIFTYQITLQSDGPNEHPLGRLSAIDWATFLADARQTVAGEQAKTVDRSSGAGDVIGFNFTPDSTHVGGTTSATLILISDAPTWKNSTVFLIDGGIDSADSLAPARLAVPDGSVTILLFGMGLLALQGTRKVLSA